MNPNTINTVSLITTSPAFESISSTLSTPLPSYTEAKGTSNSESMFSDYKFWAEMKDIVLAAAPEMELPVEASSFSTSGGSTLFTDIESSAEFKSSDEIKENIQISEGRGEGIASPISKASQDVRDLNNRLAPQRPDPANYSHLPPMLLKAIMEPVSVAPNRDRFSIDIATTIPASKRKFAAVTPSTSTIITTTSPAKKAKKEDVIEDTAATIVVTEHELSAIAPTLTSTITTSPSTEMAKKEEDVIKDATATIPTSKRKFAAVTPSTSTIIATTSPAKKAKKEDVIKDTAATILVTERELSAISPTLTSTITTSPSTEMAKKEEDMIKDAAATIPASHRELSAIAPASTSTITTSPPAEKAKEEEDVIKDAATTIPATKRKPSTVTPDSTSITTTAPPPAKEVKKAKMLSQDEIRAAIPAQGINFWELANQFGIDVKDMAKAAKFEAKVKMWFRKENGTVLLS